MNDDHEKGQSGNSILKILVKMNNFKTLYFTLKKKTSVLKNDILLEIYQCT